MRRCCCRTAVRGAERSRAPSRALGIAVQGADCGPPQSPRRAHPRQPSAEPSHTARPARLPPACSWREAGGINQVRGAWRLQLSLPGAGTPPSAFASPAPTTCLFPNSSLDNSALTTTVKITGSERQGLFVLVYRKQNKKPSSLNISENCIAKWKRERVPLLFRKSKLLFGTYPCASFPSLHLQCPHSSFPQAAHLENTL